MGRFFLKHLISKNANIHATGALHLNYAFHVAGSSFLEHFIRQNFGQFLKKIACPDLYFFQNMGSFFLKNLISKNANIRAIGPLHLNYAFHVAGSSFLEYLVHQPFW